MLLVASMNGVRCNVRHTHTHTHTHTFSTCLAAVSVPSTSKRQSVLVSTVKSVILSVCVSMLPSHCPSLWTQSLFLSSEHWSPGVCPKSAPLSPSTRLCSTTAENSNWPTTTTKVHCLLRPHRVPVDAKTWGSCRHLLHRSVVRPQRASPSSAAQWFAQSVSWGHGSVGESTQKSYLSKTAETVVKCYFGKLKVMHTDSLVLK